MRSLVVARPSAYIDAVTDALRGAGFVVDVTVPPVSMDDAARYNAIFLDGGEGEATTLRTLAMLRELKEPNAAPFVGVLGVAPDDRLGATYAAGGAQTCLPPDPRECTMRLRYIANAVSVRASLNDALRELRQSEERWRMAVGALDEGLLVQTHDGTVTTTNAAAHRILGMTEEEMRGRAWRSPEFTVRTVDGRHVGPEDLPGARALREKRPILGVVLGITTPRGHTAWASISSHPILDSAGDASGAVVTTLRDLTDQRRLEMHVMATERLTSLGRLAASVGHEINNPLTYVLGSLGGVAKRLRGLGMAEDADAIDEAMEGAERIRGIVRDLRVFSTRQPDAPAAIDVRRVVESCARMAMAEIRPRGRLVSVYGDVPPVRATEARLAQVVLNLLINAAQSLREDSTADNQVTLETRMEDDGRVAIVVRDTGVGIAPENLPLVLEPFFTTKADVGGTGLGLSICQMLVVAQGGELRIASTPGTGTEVTVLLLPALAEKPLPRREEGVERPSARHRVLVIDDEPQIARLIGECLEGCDVTIAPGGREALEILRAGRAFDVIVCDLMMPDTTGVDVHAYVAECRPELAPHMLFITGGAYTPRALAFVGRGEVRSLEKPFTPNTLVMAVERAVQGT
jgi:PAS domain S-box-containing protein